MTSFDIYSDFALRKHINHLSFSLDLHFGIDGWKTKTKTNPDAERKNQKANHHPVRLRSLLAHLRYSDI
jgi:hypothetical protein